MGRSWTTEVGHSTRAFSEADLGARMNAAVAAGGNIVELSALDEGFSEAVVSARGLARRYFRRVSVHAPADLSGTSESELVTRLASLEVPVVAHPEIIGTPALWLPLGSRLLIENCDDGHCTGRTSAELREFFAALPEARFCLDLSHAFRAGGRPVVDDLATAFGRRLDEIHLGCPGGAPQEPALEPDLLDAISAVVAVLRRPVPVIIERPAPRALALSQVYAVRVALVAGVERVAAA